MTAAEIKQYKDAIDNNYIRLFGYTSTSLSKNSALGFAWEDQHTGHSKVLFNVKWSGTVDHYYLDGGAYDHEKEVLLLDGTNVTVLAVEDAKDDEGKKIYTLIRCLS